MNICADSSCQVVQSNSIQASVSQAGNGQIDKTSQYAAQTTLQRITTLFSEQWTEYLSVTSTNVLNRASHISPAEILSSSAQAIQGIGKYALVAILVLSTAVPTVNAAGFTISCNPVYQVANGVSTLITNPPISVFGADMNIISCTLDLLGLHGNFVGPGLSLNIPGSWSIRDSQDSVNVMFRNLQFTGNKPIINASLTISCDQDRYSNGTWKSGFSRTLLTNIPIATSAIPSTQDSGLTKTNAPVTSLTTGPTTQSQLIPSTTSSALQTQSVASNLFSSMSTIASDQSQNMATGTLVTTASFLANVSQIETQLDPAQMTSTPNDFNRYGWIVLVVAGALVCLGGLTIACIVVRKKSKKEKEVEEGVPGNVVQKLVDNAQYSQVPPPPYDIVPTLNVQNDYVGIPALQQPNHYHAPAARSNNGNQGGSNIYEQPDAPMH